MYNIVVVGAGYVGYSSAVILSKQNKVTLLDIDLDKINKINNSESPIEDIQIDLENLNLHASKYDPKYFEYANFIIIALPTDYDKISDSLNCSIIDKTIDDIMRTIHRHISTIVIKSTVPIRYTESKIHKYKYSQIIFCPEFLRENSAISDSLNPDRIILGGSNLSCMIRFATVISEAINYDISKILYTDSSSAEAIKLLSNTYLAMRIAYFNEVDSICKSLNLNMAAVNIGISQDHRIGDFYNNPSFGYGGYCLPKDSKQVLSQCKDICNTDIINAVVKSNQSRIEFIAEDIISKFKSMNQYHTLGIYRLNTKQNSQNMKESPTISLLKQLNKDDLDIQIYEHL